MADTDDDLLEQARQLEARKGTAGGVPPPETDPQVTSEPLAADSPRRPSTDRADRATAERAPPRPRPAVPDWEAALSPEAHGSAIAGVRRPKRIRSELSSCGQSQRACTTGSQRPSARTQTLRRQLDQFQRSGGQPQPPRAGPRMMTRGSSARRRPRRSSFYAHSRTTATRLKPRAPRWKRGLRTLRTETEERFAHACVWRPSTATKWRRQHPDFQQYRPALGRAGISGGSIRRRRLGLLGLG